MIRPKSIPLLELAEIITAAFETYPPEAGVDARIFRSVLLRRLRERFGDDWERAWNHLADRQQR